MLIETAIKDGDIVSFKLSSGEEIVARLEKEKIVESLIADQAFNTTSMKDKMLEKVRRKNQIVIQTGFVASAGGV